VKASLADRYYLDISHVAGERALSIEVAASVFYVLSAVFYCTTLRAVYNVLVPMTVRWVLTPGSSPRSMPSLVGRTEVVLWASSATMERFYSLVFCLLP
jgi:hypothetical protein